MWGVAASVLVEHVACTPVGELSVAGHVVASVVARTLVDELSAAEPVVASVAARKLVGAAASRGNIAAVETYSFGPAAAQPSPRP